MQNTLKSSLNKISRSQWKSVRFAVHVWFSGRSTSVKLSLNARVLKCDLIHIKRSSFHDQIHACSVGSFDIVYVSVLRCKFKATLGLIPLTSTWPTFRWWIRLERTFEEDLQFKTKNFTCMTKLWTQTIIVKNFPTTFFLLSNSWLCHNKLILLVIMCTKI